MAEDVKCTVDSCTFWKHGNRCSAEMISVTSYSEERAHQSNETGCRTFKPRGL
ncbi:DUF1540 domain-containing protein [Bacillus massiliglaciei]|uniref:DUF1540 domain-containing protein n=1 Tax=Bacillus massiliglaciei TaxID=1816693 RepID=UPI000DA6046F|nr:DUF1540 domain-containing protein [Bacillus massiliglaciei]